MIAFPIEMTFCMSASSKVGAALLLNAPLFKYNFINNILAASALALSIPFVAGRSGINCCQFVDNKIDSAVSPIYIWSIQQIISGIPNRVLPKKIQQLVNNDKALKNLASAACPLEGAKARTLVASKFNLFKELN